MAKAKGRYNEASEWLREAFATDENHLSAWTMIGCMHLEREEWGPAQKKFERILEKVVPPPHPPTAMVC
jgi:RNA polymerase-associated protein CTR9